MEHSDEHISSARPGRKHQHALNLCHVIEFEIVEDVILNTRVADIYRIPYLMLGNFFRVMIVLGTNSASKPPNSRP